MRKLFIIILFFLTIYIPCISQNLYQTIRGTVIDSDSESPLIGATIQILNSNPIIATITDIEGNFVLDKVPVGRHTIEFSYVGYKKHNLSELLVGSAKEIVLTVKLKEQIQQIHGFIPNFNPVEDYTNLIQSIKES